MTDLRQDLLNRLEERFLGQLLTAAIANKQITLEFSASQILPICQVLRDEFGFEQLIDVCGVDYSQYRQTNWDTQATSTGFSRGRTDIPQLLENTGKKRFAVVYHLLSIQHNQRIRLRAFVEGEPPRIQSVINIWNSADWNEREAFDLFGILFEGHPDLRRILTDYNFEGHPLRKDFPCIGNVEVRYDPEKERIVYEPVSVESRVNIPKVIRHDQRSIKET
jgi:NADH-quinone oxidoreductase subunit C